MNELLAAAHTTTSPSPTLTTTTKHEKNEQKHEHHKKKPHEKNEQHENNESASLLGGQTSTSWRVVDDPGGMSAAWMPAWSLWEKENDLGRGEGLSKKKVIPNIW